MVEIDLNINNYKSYVDASKNFENNRAYETISVNLQNILLLKKLTCYEVNYFSNFNEAGLVIKAYGNMLKSTMAKQSAWTLLAEDMALIIKYFLAKFKEIRAVSSNWWSFYKLLFTYTYMLCQRAESKADVIVGILAEYLLSMISELNLDQLIRVLITFNYISSRTSRELRMHLKRDLDPHLCKVSVAVCKCHFFPVQLLCMETLSRWLVDRTLRGARVKATSTWFQGFTTAVQLFHDTPFNDFFGDTRWFLNQLNEKEDFVVSALCRRLFVGDLAVITDEEDTVSYVDINTSARSVTVVLTPPQARRLQVASDGPRPYTHEVILIAHDIVTHAHLHRENIQLVISITCNSPPKLLYDECSVHCNSRQVSIHISSHTDLARLDMAMSTVFQRHYQNKLDAVDGAKSQLHPSPDIIPNTAVTKAFSSSEDDRNTRFSRPHRKKSGYKIAPKIGLRSPSSVSTSSLIQLRPRLSNLPSARFPKDLTPVAMSPQLSLLAEMTEPGSSFNTTAVSTASRKGKVGFTRHKVYNTHSDNEGSDTYRNIQYNQYESKEVESKHELSLLRTVYGDTSGDDEDLVELLFKEALVAQTRKNTGDKKTSADVNNTSEAIDNTPIEPTGKTLTTRLTKPKKCTVVSNSSDESNTDAIQDTPAFVNVRRKKNTVESPGEDFDLFAALVRDNDMPVANIDPSVARQINASSDSESECGDVAQHNDVIGCLSSIIDKVCQDLDICVEEDTVTKALDNDVMEIIVNAPISKTDKDICTEIQETQNKEVKKKQKITKKGKVPRIVIKKLTPTNMNTENTNMKDPLDEIQVMPLQHERQITPEEELFKKKIVISEIKPNPKKKKQPVKKQKKKALNQNKLKFKTIENIPKDNFTPEPKKIGEINEPELVEINEIPTSESPMKTLRGSPETPPNNRKSQVTPNANKENAYDSDDAPLITRRKRKLYSPKDDEIEQAVINYEDDIDMALNAKHKQSPQVYYQDKTPKKRQRRKSKSNKPESPKTAKNNAIFDSLKETETVAKIFSVEKVSSKDIGIYNYSSDSEDEEFKQLKLNMKSRMSSSTLCSTDSLISRRGRQLRNIDYLEKNSSDDTNKKPARKSYKSKPKTPKRSMDRSLIDERMREAQPEDPNTSFVKEHKSIDKEKSPPKIIHEMEMDTGNVGNSGLDAKTTNKIGNKVQNDDLIEVIDVKADKTELKHKTLKEVPTKADTAKTKQAKNKSKNQKRQTPKVEENPKPDHKEKSESPLPDLIMETIPNNQELESSMLTNNFVEKCKQLLECSAETNTTHNLLSDSRVNESVYSPQIRKNSDDDSIINIQDDNDVETINNKEVITERNDTITDINNDGADDVTEIHNDNEDITTVPDYTHNNKITHENNISQKEDFEIINVDESETNYKPKTRKEKANIIRNIKKECNDVSKKRTYITRIENNLSISSESEEEKSIATNGNSPITAHGGTSQPPPDVDMLREVFSPRNVQVELFNKTLQNFFHDLNFEVQNSNCSLNELYSTINTKRNDRQRFNKKCVASSQEKSDTFNITLRSNTQTSKRSSISPINLDFLTRNSNKKKLELDSSLESSARSTRSVIKRQRKDIDTSNYDCTPPPPKRINTTATMKEFESPPRPSKRFGFTSREKIAELPSPPKTREQRLTGRKKIAELPSPPKTREQRLTGREKIAELPSPPKTRDQRLTGREKMTEPPKRVLESSLPLNKVDDWLMRSSSVTSSAADAFRDCALNIMEKVDTVLTETQQESNEAIIELLIKDREGLDSIEKQIEDTYENLIQLMRKSHQHTKNMLDTFKMESTKRAKEMLRKECMKKRAVVMLIREDVQAYLDERNRNRQLDD